VPGLFGIISLDRGTRVTDRAGREIFARLTDSLVHHRFEEVDRWQDPDGFMLIGRVGQAGQRAFPWPDASHPTDGWLRLLVGPADQEPAPAPPGPEPADRRATAMATLRGSYAVLDCAPTAREAVLAADRCASFPVLYLPHGRLLLFAPELEALLHARAAGRELDPAAAVSLLAYGHLLAGQTLQHGARRLRGGEALLIAGDRVRSTTWWRFEPGTAATESIDAELEAGLAEEVRSSAARQLGDPRQAVIFLSGGVDSRAVAAAAAAGLPAAAGPLNTVTWGLSEAPGTDAAIARELAAMLGSRHRFMPRTVADYGRQFAQANRLIGSGADVAAFHPNEAALMARIRAGGIHRVLRGDEAFGWSAGVTSLAEALREVKIRPLGELPAVQAVIRDDRRDAWLAAADAVLDDAVAEVRDRSPNAAKDALYFTHRLQGYLNAAAYYKLCWLDHRNPLLDDRILDFMASVPDRLRIDKLLFRRAMARAFPEAWRLPIAQASNLEDWPGVLADDTPPRAFVSDSLRRPDTALWDVLDRDRVMGLLDEVVGGPSGAAPAGHSLRATAKRRMPAALMRRWSRYRGTRTVIGTPPHTIVLRAMVLQQFVDGTMAGPLDLGPVEPGDGAG
jgi:asparagine synthetase B (glutamine-hydrolysing)